MRRRFGEDRFLSGEGLNGEGVEIWGKAAVGRKKMGKMVCALLCVAVGFGLTGCAGVGNGAEVPEAEEEKVLEIMMHLDDSFSAEGNAYIEELERLLNCRIKIRQVPFNSYNEYLSVIMASEDVPDIVQFNWNGEEMFQVWAEQGMIQPIDVEKAENIRINVPEAQSLLMKVGSDGKMYGVPGTTSRDYYGVVIRKDWLDELGLSIPGTLAEYEEVLRKFVYEDPDRDLRSNTIGMTSWKLNHYLGVFGGAFQTDYLWNSIHPDAVEIINGTEQAQAVLREQQTGYLPMLDYIRKLYEEGLLDKDFESLQNAEARFLQGKIGMIGAYTKDVINLEKKLKTVVPEAELIWALPPGDEQGRVWNFMPVSYGYNGAGSLYGKNSVFVITGNAEYELALSFLDQMNTRDMILLSNLGIQGVHYESYDSSRKTIRRTQEQSKRADRELFGVSDTYRNESFAFLWDNQEESDRLEYYWQKGNLLITNPQCYQMSLSGVNTDFLKENPFFRETERNHAIAYVVGKMSAESYTAYLEESAYTRKAVLYDIQEKYRKYKK